MKSWSQGPGAKVIVTKRVLEDLIHHLENPDMFAPNQYEQDAKMIKEQLAEEKNAYES